MFDEKEHPRDNDGKFSEKGGDEKSGKLVEAVRKYSDSPERDLKEMWIGKKKMTPLEKIESVHIDFDRDNILPELNEKELDLIGAENSKPVLLKKGIIDRNREEHDDITDDDFEKIIANALYTPSEVFAANKNKPYFHFAKVVEINSIGKPEIGLVLLDVDDKKENFEIVHAHFIRDRSYETIKRKK